MKLVDKYLLRQYLVPFAYCLVFFCAMSVVFDLFSRLADFLDAQTPPLKTVFFYLNFLLTVNGNAPFLVLILPVCLLLGALYSLYQLTRHNELTAMMASGVSFLRLMAPFLCVGLFFSIAAALVQETVAPMAGRRAEAFLRNELGKSPLQQMISPFPYYNSALRRHWLIDPFDPRHPERLSHVKIIQERTDGTREEEIYADKAEWLDGHWWLHRARVQQYDPHGQPAGPLLPPSEHPLEMPDWSETPADFANEVCPWELLSSLEMFKFLKTHPDLSRENRAGKSVDLYSRLAMPWTCFVVVLLGVPVGARTARQGLMMSVFLAIGLFFAFYAAVHVGFFLGKRQLLWPWLSAWLPNIAFSAAGLMLLFKMR